MADALKKLNLSIECRTGSDGRGRTDMRLPSQDFESCASSSQLSFFCSSHAVLVTSLLNSVVPLPFKTLVLWEPYKEMADALKKLNLSIECRIGADGRGRTDMRLPSQDFESCASAISPHRHIC